VRARALDFLCFSSKVCKPLDTIFFVLLFFICCCCCFLNFIYFWIPLPTPSSSCFKFALVPSFLSGRGSYRRGSSLWAR
jgi:hypothetical protein